MSLLVDPHRIPVLLAVGESPLAVGEPRRERNVFFLDGECPVEATLEAILASDSRAPVELFCFHFPDLAAFVRGEKTISAVGKNFRGYLLGNFGFLPAAPVIDQAYAAGIDLLDLPQPQSDEAGDRDLWLAALEYARTVFPRWGVLSTVPVGAGSLAETRATIDLLLARGVLPWLLLASAAGNHDENALVHLFDYLRQQWRRAGALIKPLLPLLPLTTPLSGPPRRGLAVLVDKVQDAQWRAAADLRRLLRVREVEQSFESAGL